jgi:hypothetical protein
MSLEGTFTPQNFCLLLVTKVRDRKKIVFNLKIMNLIKEFIKIRDIPYMIPLSLNEFDNCCS